MENATGLRSRWLVQSYVKAAHEFVQVKGPRDIPRSKYPLLVTFTDISSPKSVKEVNPDNLAVTFGLGYSLKSMTLEITDDPVTEGKVEGILKWAVDLEGSIGKGMKLSYDHLLNQISDGSFIQRSEQ